MLELTPIVQGSAKGWTLEGINQADSSIPGGFLDSDNLTGVLWQGNDQAPLFLLTPTWVDSSKCIFFVSLTNAQSATLDSNATYHIKVDAQRQTTIVSLAYVLLPVLPAPGTASETIVPYCTLEDVLQVAPWVTMVQDFNSDLEGFYLQRLEAKTWLDWLIIRAWRGTAATYFGNAGSLASSWTGSGAWRSSLPSPWLVNLLAGGIVQQSTVKVTSGGTGYTFANAVFTGGGAPDGSQATAFASVGSGIVTSITLTSPGKNYVSAPNIALVGDGTGATATCGITTHVLILRPNIVKVCALKAASLIGLAQIGRNNTLASFGAMFRDQASAEVVNLVAELDTTGIGIATLTIPLNSTNTLFS